LELYISRKSQAGKAGVKVFLGEEVEHVTIHHRLTRDADKGINQKMILDFHNHIYPENVARAVIHSLKSEMGFSAYGTGTVSGLRDEMKSSGVNTCVVLGVAVSPDLVEATNRWILKQGGNGFIPIGSIHPFYQQYRPLIKELKKAGIMGVKFHPLFQNFHPDDERVFPLYEELINQDLFLIFHSGPGLIMKPGEEVMGTPERMARLLDVFPKMTLVVAHFGGFRMIDEARKHLIGKNVYIDTSYPPGLCFESEDWVLDMIQRHDPDRILFGTDTPYASQKEDIEYILRLPISIELKEKILYKNGSNLLGLNEA
jgi:predicted TIM-barrel fold metal-dependent hydrolase